MELAFLGTNSAMPKKDRNVSSLFIRPDQRKEFILVDCGEGTQNQFVKFEGYSVAKIRLILITHLHGDHCFGLPGLLCTISGQLGKENEVITVVGPLGIKKMLSTVLKLSGSYLTYKLNIIELVPKGEKIEKLEDDQSSTECEREEVEGEAEVYSVVKKSSYAHLNNENFYECGTFFDLKIRAVEIDHHRIFCVGYVLEEPDKKGSLSTEKLYEEYGIYFGKVSNEFMKKNDLGKFNFRNFSKEHPTIPKNFIKLLKSGKDVHYAVDNEEKVIKVEKVLTDGKKGRKVIVLGDCYNGDPNDVLTKEFGIKKEKKKEMEEEEGEGEGEEEEEEEMFGVDLLVHECTFENKLESDASTKGHATPNILTSLCKKLRPRKCYINHFSPRYGNSVEDDPSVYLLLNECREVYPHVELAEDFKVVRV